VIKTVGYCLQTASLMLVTHSQESYTYEKLAQVSCTRNYANSCKFLYKKLTKQNGGE